MENKKKEYETPIIEIEELVLEDSIADSGMDGIALGEDIWK